MESSGPGNGFNGLGAAAFLATLWFIAVIRDLLAVRAKRKDFDDVLLYLLAGVTLQLIAYGVLPYNGVLPILNDNASGATKIYLTWWIMPNNSWPGYFSWVAVWFRVACTALVASCVAPIVGAIAGKKVPAGILLVLVLIFAVPLAFVGDIWFGITGLGTGQGIAIGALLLVVFYIVLLLMTRGKAS
jgi:hypothetical protein